MDWRLVEVLEHVDEFAALLDFEAEDACITQTYVQSERTKDFDFTQGAALIGRHFVARQVTALHHKVLQMEVSVPRRLFWQQMRRMQVPAV